MSTTSNAYVPGVCNINPTEVAYRRKAGWAGIIISLIVLLPLLLLDISRWWRVIVALPLFLGILGFLQAKNRFCVAYASSGAQNASGDKMDTAKKVSAANRAADKLKANKMYLQAAGFSLVLTAACLLAPRL